ncbi:MAG: pseudouridine synthase [Alcaligenaceae bacterium]|nr:pseudouridine synthase [Alcaligenaceae bacterium]
MDKQVTQTTDSNTADNRRGRKLRTPFRRRRADATSAAENKSTHSTDRPLAAGAAKQSGQAEASQSTTRRRASKQVAGTRKNHRAPQNTESQRTQRADGQSSSVNKREHADSRPQHRNTKHPAAKSVHRPAAKSAQRRGRPHAQSNEHPSHHHQQSHAQRRQGRRPSSTQAIDFIEETLDTALLQEEEFDLGRYNLAADGEQRVAKFLNNDQIRPKLHKVLADAGVGSRRDMEQLIIAGRVSVNGEPAHVGQRVGQEDVVRVNGRTVRRPRVDRPPRVILYYKPAGEIVTHDDPEGRATVFSRLPNMNTAKWLSVGRLDLNTEGLLIFTTSGDFANRMMHPRYGYEREYAVRILGELDESQRAQMLKGITLEDGPAKFNTVEFIGGEGTNRWYRVTLFEGRNREVRRMFESVGLTVSRLLRTRFGDITLPRNLSRGRWQELEADVVLGLMAEMGMALPQVEQTPQGRGARRQQGQPGRPGRQQPRQPVSNANAMPPGFEGGADRSRGRSVAAGGSAAAPGSYQRRGLTVTGSDAASSRHRGRTVTAPQKAVRGSGRRGGPRVAERTHDPILSDAALDYAYKPRRSHDVKIEHKKRRSPLSSDKNS